MRVFVGTGGQQAWLAVSDAVRTEGQPEEGGVAKVVFLC